MSGVKKRPRSLLAKRVRELEKRMRALEVDKALTYAADSEVIGMDEKIRGAVGSLVSALRFHRNHASKLEGAIGSALSVLAPAVMELLEEKGEREAYEAVFGKED